MAPGIFVGCAGWTLPAPVRSAFPAEGTHLSRYAARFPAVEINSSFHRPHRPTTYERWAASVPESFRFSVKLPKQITHVQRLKGSEEELEEFLAQISGLGGRLGCVLVQLPPSLELDTHQAGRFFEGLAGRHAGPVVVEPRHPSWFTPAADRLLESRRVSRVAADPARVPEAGQPGGWSGTVYFRLHGSPRMYYSAYDDAYLDRLAHDVRSCAGRADAVWCIFDNTASGAATADALGLLARLD